MLKTKKYQRYNKNSFTLRKIVKFVDIYDSVVNLDIGNRKHVDALLSGIIQLYSINKDQGLYAWDAGNDFYNELVQGENVAIIFLNIGEVFVGRFLCKFFDPDCYFQERVGWKTPDNYRFRHVLLFDKGKYFTGVTNDIFNKVKYFENLSLDELFNIFDKEFIDISSMSVSSHPLNVDENVQSSIINYIYSEKQGIWCPRKLFQNIKEEINFTENEFKIYLGTYFPRSMTQCLDIFRDINNSKYFQKLLKSKKEINILDIGSGTGGDLFGLLIFLKENNLLKCPIKILSIDKSKEALSIQREIFEKFFINDNIDLIQHQWKEVNSRIDILSKLKEELEQFNGKFDFVLSFKFVNELYRIGNNKPLYKGLLDITYNYLKFDGIVLFADVTDKYDEINYLSIQMNNEIQEFICEKNHTFGIVLPISCAKNFKGKPIHKCFKQKMFYNTNPNPKYSSDKEKLCFFLIATVAVQQSILKETIKSRNYKVAYKETKDEYCSKGDPIAISSTTEIKDAFSLKDNLI